MPFASDVVLETKVLVSRHLEDKNISLGLETKSLGPEIKVLVLISGLDKQESCAIAKMTAMRAIYVDRKLLWRYGHSKLSKMAAAAILNLFESKIAPLDTPSPKTPS